MSRTENHQQIQEDEEPATGQYLLMLFGACVDALSLSSCASCAEIWGQMYTIAPFEYIWQEKGHGSALAWGDEATINILFAEFRQGAAEPSWICSEFSVQQPGALKAGPWERPNVYKIWKYIREI